ncbi:hypothetical protein LzC2_32980 [Planctomycetes bacterium LzC2]|uniref:Signal transduction histidine kinase subgroup 3 dimerisation and phosphoacceptor domain-containing protein n=2 Tax=Alienimonas chondri TaxID=2681879 RepID=A0ABX1VIZ3_9PLAN|nr:hypothetical protein [Alienimonas chondri]
MGEVRYAGCERRAYICRMPWESRYQTLCDSIDHGYCVIRTLFDDDGNCVDYEFLETNRAFHAQTGLDDVIGRRIREFAPNHEPHWFDIYGRVARTGEFTRFVQEAKALNRWYEVTAFRVGEPEERTVAVLFDDVTDRLRAEQELRDLTATLEQRVAERTESLRRLAVRMTGAEETERRRIAHTLHDHLQQVLVGAKIWTGLVARGAEADRAEAQNHLTSMLDEAIQATRTLAVELCPPVLREQGLAAALRWLAGNLKTTRRFHVSVHVSETAEPAAGERSEGERSAGERAEGESLAGRLPDVPTQLEAFLYQAASELLLNSQKHSGVDAAGGAAGSSRRRPATDRPRRRPRLRSRGPDPPDRGEDGRRGGRRVRPVGAAGAGQPARRRHRRRRRPRRRRRDPPHLDCRRPRLPPRRPTPRRQAGRRLTARPAFRPEGSRRSRRPPPGGDRLGRLERLVVGWRWHFASGG